MNLSPLPVLHLTTNDGKPAVGYKLFSYVSSTSTKTPTYKDADGTTNTNPIFLDYRGECRLWIDPELSYKFVFAAPDDTDPPTAPIWSVDKVTAGPISSDNAAQGAGSSNSVILSIPKVSALTPFLRLVFRALSSNTGPTTLTLNGLPAKPIRTQLLQDLAGGEIQSAGIYEVIYDGVQFQLMGPTLNRTDVLHDAEKIAGVFPVNYAYDVGVVDRYFNHSSEGVTDASTGVQNCANVIQAAIGLGEFGIPMHFLSKSYNLVTPPIWDTSINVQPIVIEGEGWGTQIINNASGNKPTFDMTGLSGWRIKNLLGVGNSAHPNDFSRVNTIGGPQSINWGFEGVMALMAGRFAYCADTNTGYFRDCIAWPGNTTGLVKTNQVVNGADIKDHVYLTGGFAHNIKFDGCQFCPNDNYFVGHRGIKLDAATFTGLDPDGGLYQTLSGLNTEVGIDMRPSGSGNMGLRVPYMEGATLLLKNVRNSDFSSIANGGVGGGVVMESGCTENVFTGLALAKIDVQSTTSIANSFIGCLITTVTDLTLSTAGVIYPNHYLACSFGAVNVPDYGGCRYTQITFPGAGGAVTIDARTVPFGGVAVLRVTDTTAFNISITQPLVGHRFSLVMRNESGGVIIPAFIGSIKTDTVTPPTNTNQRRYDFYYDGVAGLFWYGQQGALIAN